MPQPFDGLLQTAASTSLTTACHKKTSGFNSAIRVPAEGLSSLPEDPSPARSAAPESQPGGHKVKYPEAAGQQPPPAPCPGPPTIITINIANEDHLCRLGQTDRGKRTGDRALSHAPGVGECGYFAKGQISGNTGRQPNRPGAPAWGGLLDYL
jgi:hypothetical protein